MKISGWEKLSLVDFDDYVCTTVFCANCNMRCPFCHNAFLVLGASSAPSIPYEEVRSYLSKRKGILEGVCISGGEPTLSPDLPSVLKDIKSLGYKIKLDTNGYRPDVIRECIDSGLVDYFAMDIKNSPSLYGKTAGIADLDMSRIENSVNLIMRSGIEYEFRTTIIKEFHDARSIGEAAMLIRGAKKYFLQMYIDRDGCIEHGFHAFSKEEAEELRIEASKHVEEAYLRNYD